VLADCGAYNSTIDQVDTYGIVGPRPPAPPPPSFDPPAIPDWHYPPEEQQEWESLTVPTAESINLTAESALLALPGTSPVVATVGQVVLGGWTLRSVLLFQNGSTAIPTVVLEFNFQQWGVLAVRTADPAFLEVLRKGVGAANTLEQPAYSLDQLLPDYYALLGSVPNDYVVQQISRNTSQPTYEDMIKFLPPSADYGLLGTIESRMKWVVVPNGRIKRANNSLYEDLNNQQAPPAGEVIFDPSKSGVYWCSNFTSLKSALLGGSHRAISTVAWSSPAKSGFEQLAVADGPGDGSAWVSECVCVNAQLPDPPLPTVWPVPHKRHACVPGCVWACVCL
jgi:hypothetical protein